MILFRACPRCGGDVDATYQDDAYCIQCSHRPEVAYPGPRVIHHSSGTSVGREPVAAADRSPNAPMAIAASPTKDPSTKPCPRCDSSELIVLDRLRDGDNTCYRCRRCGHIFSPASGEGVGPRRAAIQ